MTVNDGRSVLTLDHDRAGPRAVVLRLTTSCETVGATLVISGQPGVRSYMGIDRLSPQFSATRTDVFAGGCVTTRLTGSEGSQAQLYREVSLVLGFTTRQALRLALETRSGGRLHLDPATES
jgi:hypothetical protein